MLTTICSRCGKLIKQGARCPSCKAARQREYDRDHRNQESKAFYNSKSWKLLQKAVASRAGYIDEYIKFYKGRIELGKIAHHIQPVNECPELALVGRNIIFVSAGTHQMIHSEYAKGKREKEDMQRRLYRVLMDCENNFDDP